LSHDFPTSASSLAFWLERQRYDRVIEEGRRLLAQSPEDPDLHRLVAIAHWMLNDQKSANHHLRESLRLRADDESSLSLLALINSSSLGSRKSDRHALQALALDPDSLTAWHALASSSLGDDTEFCMRCCRRMLQIDPRNISARMLLHAAVSMNEDVPGWDAEAERWLREALAIEPENADLHALMGMHLLPIKQRRKEGEDHLRHAIAADPMSPQAATWRESLARQRDLVLKLLILPRRISTGIVTAMGRSLSRYPLLILLGKFYLIAFVLCLMALIFWGIFLWPVVWLYRKYVIHGDLLRARTVASGKRWLGDLVPSRLWLRRIIVLVAMVGWWRLVPEIFAAIGRIHPDLHSGNVVAIVLTTAIVGGAGLLSWVHLRKIRRRKEMGGLPPVF
jgi:Flp pilus assembly protein TadD